MAQDDQFSQVLHLPIEKHRASLIPNKPHFVMSVNVHQPGLEYNESYGPALQRLGLYQLALICNDRKLRLDRSLITALTERWRPETNTFHLKNGEMTVTLEDVSCLWGLPVRGAAITGYSDDDWSGLVEDCLGVDPAYPGGDPDEGPWKFKATHRGEENENIRYSGYHLRLAWLRHTFAVLPDDADEATVAHYTRAYCLDLLGSVMFPDTSGDGVPAMLLQFLWNLEDPPEYNWGGAVLAYLYRELSRGCLADTDSLCGPMLLLQMWSWSRLPNGRPEALSLHRAFGGDDLNARNAYGIRWTTKFSFQNNPHRAGTKQYRDQLEKTPLDAVNWRPYTIFYPYMPSRSFRDSGIWLTRTPLIFFWIVEFHYPERVMRQFDMYQTVPPPDPYDWPVVSYLRTFRHKAGRGKAPGKNWYLEHQHYVEMAPILVQEHRQWDQATMVQYMHWYFTCCMHTVFYEHGSEEALDQPPPRAEGTLSTMTYQSDGARYRRLVYRTIWHTRQGIKWALTRGKKAVGKMTLQMCRGNLSDLDHGHIYEGMVARAGISPDLDNIYVDDDIPSATDDPPFLGGDPPFTGGDPPFTSFADDIMDEWFPTDPPPYVPPTQETAPSTSQAGPSTSQAGPSTSQAGPSRYQLPPREGRGTRTARYTPSPLIPRSRREPPQPPHP